MNLERSENSKPFVSVVVPVYNDGARFATCLAALEEQTYPRELFEVVVVDNGSEQTVACVVERFQQARFCVEPHPGSYSARNHGLALSRSEIIAFTDSDCVPAPDWIERGVEILNGAKDCGLVAGRIEGFFDDPRRPTAVELYESVTAHAQKTFVEVGRFGATANLFTRRKVFERVGAFDANIKSGGDVEWGSASIPQGSELCMRKRRACGIRHGARCFIFSEGSHA